MRSPARAIETSSHSSLVITARVIDVKIANYAGLYSLHALLFVHGQMKRSKRRREAAFPLFRDIFSTVQLHPASDGECVKVDKPPSHLCWGLILDEGVQTALPP